jgi:hypothetical protein
MKICYFSDSHFLEMKEKFESSFKDDFDKQYHFVSNINIDRTKPGSGTDIWKYKTQMIIDTIKENLDDIVIISDIDIIFYKPVLPIILNSMFNNEICFQKEHSNHGINIGFISIYCNENTLKFWEKVYEILCNSDRWDQEIVNDLLYNEKYNIKWNLFPSSIWNWTQGSLNKNIALHHANCVITKEDKFKQMEYVDEFINGKKLGDNSQLPVSDPCCTSELHSVSNVDMNSPRQSMCLDGTKISVSQLSDDSENAENYYLKITPRVGDSVKNNNDIRGADCNYRGEIFVYFINNSDDINESAADRIAQMVLKSIKRFNDSSISVKSHE